eukprot:COSAG01_NODE_3920_length_5536_cov_14.374655_1_plen_148_part_00
MRVGGALKLMVDVVDAYGDMDCGEIPDPYVKVGIEYGRSGADGGGGDGAPHSGGANVVRTKALNDAVEPHWDESFVLSLEEGGGGAERAPRLCCSLWDQDIGKDDLLGTFFFEGVAGLEAGAEEPTELWLESTLGTTAAKAVGSLSK